MIFNGARPRSWLTVLRLFFGVTIGVCAWSSGMAAETPNSSEAENTLPAGTAVNQNQAVEKVTEEPPGVLKDGREPYNASLRISGSALRPRDDTTEFTVGSQGGCVYVTSGDSYTVWNTPLVLPQDAVIEYLRLYFHDTSATDMESWITVYDLFGQIVAEWRLTSVGTGGDGYTTSDLINHTVNHFSYSYVFNWRPKDLGSDTQLCGLRVWYFDPVVFMDGFESGDTRAWN